MFSITRPKAKQALLYFILVSGIASVLMHLFVSPERAWLICSAYIFAFILLRNPCVTVGCIISFTLLNSVCLASFFAPSLPFIICFLFLTTMLCVWLSELYKKYFFLLLVLNIFTILASYVPTNTSESLGLVYNCKLVLDRIFFIFLGIGIAMGCKIIFIPKWIQRESRSETDIALQQLTFLSQEIFSCFHAEYSNNRYLFERRIHLQKNIFFKTINEMQELVGNKPIISKLNQLFEILMSCAQLRRRASDGTIFSVCQDELKTLAKALMHDFNKLRWDLNNRNNAKDNYILLEKIQQFELIYQNVLQVTAKEPLVFLLFIFDLKNLQTTMQEFNLMIFELVLS